MKKDLKDVTFLILIRLDSIQRLENILVVTERLLYYFDTNIIIYEADDHNNYILESLLNWKVVYKFIEDKDPVLHKTKYYNVMTKEVNTPIVSIWDADTVIDKIQIEDAISRLRNDEADVAYPYNGQFLDIPEIIKKLYWKKKDVRILHRNKPKMELLYNLPLVGGAVFMNREKYIEAGLENEKHYGWSNDDFDRYYRFMNLNYRIYRTKGCLYHLSHPRGDNSQFRSRITKEISESELAITKNSLGEVVKNNTKFWKKSK